ncbi:hypothetical protein Bca101_027599 [Brassica carinata]
MSDNLRRAIQDLTLGIEDEPVALSIDVCTEARRATQFSLMGRPTILRKQNLRAMMTSLPRTWGLTEVVLRRIVEKKKFWFVFPSEDLLQSVLSRGPWAYNDRMLIITRWNPALGDAQLNHIPLWVQIRGIPLEFLTSDMIKYIGDRIGEVLLVDFKPEMVGDVDFVRVQLNWDVSLPLRFQRNFQFYPGLNTLLKFRSERLCGFCEDCGMMTHDSGECLPAIEDHQDESNHDDDQHDGDDQGNIAQPDNVGMEVVDQLDAHEVNEESPRINPQGSHMALLGQLSSRAPMDIVREESGMRYEERALRKRKFSEEGGAVSAIMAKDKGVSDASEDDDHIILEMEERWKGSARAQELSPDVIPTSVENYKMGSTSVKKPKGGCDMIDKFPGFLKDCGEDRDIGLRSFWILWFVWRSRNEFFFNRRNVQPMVDANKACQANSEWIMSVKANQPTIQRHINRLLQWKPPPSE